VTDGGICGDSYPIGETGAWRCVTVIEENGEFARLGIDTFDRIEANLDAEGDKGAKRS
jgi:hypothetical protein